MEEKNLNPQATSVEPKQAPAGSSKKKLMKVFDLFEKALEIYQKNWKKLVSMYLVGVVAVLPATIFAALLPVVAGNILLSILIWALLLASFAFAVYVGVLYQAGAMLFFKNGFKPVWETLKEARPYFWPYLWTSALLALAVLLWSLLLIIPGIIFSVFYTFALYVLIFEGPKYSQALKRSKDLVKGYWWEIFGRVLFIALAFYLFFVVISIPGFFATEGSAFYNAWGIVTNLLSVAVAPIFLAYTYLLFNDLKRAKG